MVLPRAAGAPPGAPLTAFDARPGLAAFLAAAAASFEVVVFTAGARSYADPVLDALDPSGTLFSARLYREACIRVAPRPEGRARLEAAAAASTSTSSSSFRPPPLGGAWVMKDLAALGRPLARTVLVDNTPTVFGYQPANGIPVSSWHGGGGSGGGGGGRGGGRGVPSSLLPDSALTDLLPLLDACAAAPDVRPVIAAAFPATLGVVLAAVAAYPGMFACARSVLVESAEVEAVVPPVAAVAAKAVADAALPSRSASPSSSSAASAGTAAPGVALPDGGTTPPAAATAANNALASATAALAGSKRPRSAAGLPTPSRSAPTRWGRGGGAAQQALAPSSAAVCA